MLGLDQSRVVSLPPNWASSGEHIPSAAAWEVCLVLLLAEKKFKNYSGQESSEVAMKLTVRPMPQDSSLLDF